MQDNSQTARVEHSDIEELSMPARFRVLQDDPLVESEGIRRRNRRILFAVELLFVVAFSTFICFWNLGQESIWFFDEGQELQPVQEALYEGNWFSPTLKGKPYFKKPPLRIWLSLVPLSIFGESNFTHRVVDATAGLLTFLLVYFFARSIFAFRGAGLFTVLSLLGSSGYVLFHGVRMGVQDSLLVFLCALALISGWKFIENAGLDKHRSTNPPFVWRWCLLSGVSIGLGVLAKNALGFMPGVVLAVFLVVSGRLPSLWRNSRLPLFTLGITALLVPALYLVPHFLLTPGAWDAIVMHELVKRGTVGFHNQGNFLFYFYALIHRQVAVPAMLLVLSIPFAIYLWRKDRSDAQLFCLLWALLPPVLYSIPNSRSVWYIAPAFPGMALLVGSMIGCLWSNFSEGAIQWWKSRTRPRLLWYPSAALFVYCFILLLLPTLFVSNQVLEKKEELLFDNFSEEVLALKEEHPSIGPVIYHQGLITTGEYVYKNMLRDTAVLKRNKKAVAKSLQENPNAFVITTPEKVPEIIEFGEVTGYNFIPPFINRRGWLTLLSFSQDFQLKSLLPAKRRIRFFKPGLSLLYGFPNVLPYLGEQSLTMRGREAALLLKGDNMLEQFGSHMQLKLAARQVPEVSALPIQVYLNHRVVAEEVLPTGEFRSFRFSVPPGVWKPGSNTLIFVVDPSQTLPVSARTETASLSWLRINLAQPKSSPEF